MKDRTERANQTMRDLAAEFVAREAGPQSLITVTRAEVEPNFSHAKIFITVLPEDKEEGALGVINRSITEFKKYLEERARFPHLPYITFEIDRGQKNEDRLMELS